MIDSKDSPRSDPSRAADGEQPSVEVPDHGATGESTPLIERDLLVEDVSIDGMCGVY